jgi:hypothetical protein
MEKAAAAQLPMELFVHTEHEKSLLCSQHTTRTYPARNESNLLRLTCFSGINFTHTLPPMLRYSK